MSERQTLADHVDFLLKNGVRCNCDLDNWEPERSTGHSWVCRIHRVAIARYTGRPIRGVPGQYDHDVLKFAKA